MILDMQILDITEEAKTTGRPHEIHKPNLDSLADDGVILTNHYAYKICSPSRSSLQSGRLAVHVNTVNTGVTGRESERSVSGLRHPQT